MRLRPVIGWGVFFVLFAVLTRAVPSPTAAFYFLKGKRSVLARDYKAAVSAYQQAINANPKFTRAYIELGTTQLALENYSAAETAFKDALQVEEDACAACGLGMVYRLERKNIEAESVLIKATRLDPRDYCAYNQLGRLYYDLEYYKKSIEAFNHDVRLHPNATSYHFLANATYYSGEVEGSLQYYKKSIQLNSKYEPVYTDVARAYNRLGRHVEAISAYERALELNPDDVTAHVGLGFTNLLMGNYKAAREEYERLLELDAEWAKRLLKKMKERSS